MYHHPANLQGDIIPVKSYVFHAALEQEEDGRWSAWIEALPRVRHLGLQPGRGLGGPERSGPGLTHPPEAYTFDKRT